MSRISSEHKLVCSSCGYGSDATSEKHKWTGYAYDDKSMDEQLKVYGENSLDCDCGGTAVHAKDCWCVPGQTETW